MSVYSLPVSKPHEKTVIRSLPIGHRKIKKSFAVWMYNNLRFSEPLLRLLPHWGQACQNSQVLLEVLPRNCLGWFYQHCLRSLWTDFFLRLLPLLSIEVVILSQFCDRFSVHFFTDMLCASRFQVLERDLTAAPRLRNEDKIKLRLT